MPRTKAESTADAVEEQKTDAVEDTAPVQAEEPKAPAESEYTIEELADCSSASYVSDVYSV